MVTDPRVARGMAAQFELRGRRLERGARPLGWKIGFGSDAARARLGTDGPLVGFLTDDALLQSGAEVPLDGWKNASLEPELAIHIDEDVAGTGDTNAVASAIAGLGPAIELADLHSPDASVEEILSGNIFNRHVLLGAVDRSRAGGDTSGVSARVFKNGDQVAATDHPEALTGNLVAIVQHLATVLEANGERLRAGDVVIAGSVVPAIQVSPGDQVRVQVEPLGELEVRFS